MTVRLGCHQSQGHAEGLPLGGARPVRGGWGEQDEITACWMLSGPQHPRTGLGDTA